MGMRCAPINFRMFVPHTTINTYWVAIIRVEKSMYEWLSMLH